MEMVIRSERYVCLWREEGEGTTDNTGEGGEMKRGKRERERRRDKRRRKKDEERRKRARATRRARDEAGLRQGVIGRTPSG